MADGQPPFGLYTTFPREQIPLQKATLEDVGLQSGTLLTMECDAINFDPILVFDELLKDKVCFFFLVLSSL